MTEHDEHQLLRAALQCPRPGDEMPPDLSALLIAQQAAAPGLSPRETWAWLSAPLLVGAAAAAWMVWGMDLRLDASLLQWALPLVAATGLHALWPSRRPA